MSNGLIVDSASDYGSSSESPSIASVSTSDSDYVSGSVSGSYLSIAVHSSSVHGISDIVTASYIRAATIQWDLSCYFRMPRPIACMMATLDAP